MNKNTVIGLLGPTLDAKGRGQTRWDKWRPSVALAMHEDFLIDRYELVYQREFSRLAHQVAEDIRIVSPETELVLHQVEIQNPWDFEEVYGILHDFSQKLSYNEETNYHISITTGTHVEQICFFLLSESRHFPGKLIQSNPDKNEAAGLITHIDLDLSRYDNIANRFREESHDAQTILKSGIATQDPDFNSMIEQIETVSLRSDKPILLRGPTGSGKSQLARRVYEMKQQRRLIEGPLVEINCATLQGSMAMSTLFGHKKGAFTGAGNDRDGLLKKADQGILFLDEIGELGSDEQAMLLRALEHKTFLPVGSDEEIHSDFQLICGTNRNLREDVKLGNFRADLLARINIWDFELPDLRERRADLEPNIDYELQKYSGSSGQVIRFNLEARRQYLKFARSSEATWEANFRDLNASIHRMATLTDKKRISEQLVKGECQRLNKQWSANKQDDWAILEKYLGPEARQELDLFDCPQLAYTLHTCEESKNLAEAGRKLFSRSRTQRKSSNDSDRLRKYLAKFDISSQDFTSSPART